MIRKIYDVRQSAEKDCGPASLLSILKYYNGFVPLEKIKIDAKTTMLGTSALNLINAAKKYGLDGVGYKLNKETLLSQERIFPYIAHTKENNFEHYIVVYQVKNNKVIIMDPAKGKKIISIDTFFEISTGFVIEFYPRSEVIIMKKENRLLDMFLLLLKTEKKAFVCLFLASLITTILTISLSFYFKIGIENIDNNLDYLKYISTFFLTITIFKTIFINLKNNYHIYINKNIDTRLYREFFIHLFNLPSKDVDNKSLGEIVTRLNDLGTIKGAFVQILLSFFLDFLLTLIAVPLLIYINKTLFLILLGLLILYLVVGIIYSKIVYPKIITNKEYETIFSKIFIENVTMFKNIKQLNKTDNFLKKIEYSFNNYLYDSFKLEKIKTYEENIKNFINEVGLYLVNAIGLYLIYKSKLSVVDLITFNTLMSFFLEPIKNLIDNIPNFNFVRASIYKLNEFMSIEKEICLSISEINELSINFKDVTYSYNKLDNVLSKKNLFIKQGEHIFIYGKSGGGKSTFCKLLLKNLNDYSGDIFIGGNNLKDLSKESIRKNILYISQKEYLFTDTIKNNILFTNEYDFKKFNKVCNICGIENILENKKLRYESFIEMDANNFSGGEKQRIILARNLYNGFEMLIIDEALSELDIVSEKTIIDNLKKEYKKKTIIYISHKNLKSSFDKVIEFDEY